MNAASGSRAPDSVRAASPSARPALGSRLLARARPEPVGLREAPFTAVFLVAASVLATHPETDQQWLLGTAVVVVVVQLVAVLGRWHRWPASAQYVPPLVQLSCLVGLDYASTVNPSYFAVLLFLPVVSLALQPSVIGMVLGTAATAGITVGAAVAENGPFSLDPVAVLRTVVVTACALLVGVGVHAVTQRLRDRTDDLLRLQAEQEATLQTLAEQRDRLSDLADRLESSRSLFRSVIEASTEVLVLACDHRGRVLVSSPGAERVLGRTAESLIDTPVTDLFEPSQLGNEPLPDAGGADRRTDREEDSATALTQAAVGSAARGEPEHRETAFVRQDGSTVPVDLVVTQRRRIDAADSDGYLLVATDLTDRHESERLQDEFVGLVSHELRTPLASILGYTELLRARPEALGEDERRYLDVVDRNAQRLLRLVNDLLLSVQLAAGTFPLAPEGTDAAQVMAESVSNLRPTATAAGVTLSLLCDGPVPLVTDRERLGQIGENLIANAVKFTPAGGSVQVSLSGETAIDGRHAARLIVADSGRGMNEEEIAQVTARFFRTDSARRSRVRGLGLGLSIVDAIVRGHGGTMTISSRPKEGTRIEVMLPDLAPAISSKPGPALSNEPESSASTA